MRGYQRWRWEQDTQGHVTSTALDITNAIRSLVSLGKEYGLRSLQEQNYTRRDSCGKPDVNSITGQSRI